MADPQAEERLRQILREMIGLGGSQEKVGEFQDALREIRAAGSMSTGEMKQVMAEEAESAFRMMIRKPLDSLGDREYHEAMREFYLAVSLFPGKVMSKKRMFDVFCEEMYVIAGDIESGAIGSRK